MQAVDLYNFPAGKAALTFSATGLPTSQAELDLPKSPSPWIIAFETLIGLMIFIASLLGNILVITVIQRSRRLQSTTNFFVVSLAFSDIIITVFCMPFTIISNAAQRWVFGPFICQFIRYIQMMAFAAVIYVTLAISVDRYYTIIYPLSFKITRGKAKRMIVLSWAGPAILATPCFYFFSANTIQFQNSETLNSCPSHFTRDTLGLIYVYFIVSIGLVIPCFVIVITYTKIFRHIWILCICKFSLQRTSNIVPRNKVKTVKMLIIVTLVTFCLWTPFFILQLTAVSIPVHVLNIHDISWVAVVWLAFAASVAKPAVYAIYNPNFRRGCKEVFCSSTCRCYRKENYAITHATRFARKHHIGTILPYSLDYATNLKNKSTYDAFDREANGDTKMAWPLPSGTNTTYL